MRNYFSIFISACVGISILVQWGCSGHKYTAANSWKIQKDIPKNQQVRYLIQANGSCYDDEIYHLLHTLREQEKKLPVDYRAKVAADIGITAFFKGCYNIAASSLDDAIAIMGGVTSDPERVAKILSQKGSEQMRIFKGEPFEKALVFLFRGLIYLNNGDFDNARACFKAGQIQDSRIINGKPEWGNWISLRYLENLTYFWQDGFIPDEKKFPVPKGLSIKWPSSGDNTLMIIAVGQPPSKILLHDKRNYRLSYRASSSAKITVEVSDPLSNKPLLSLTLPSEDIFIQAASHGRREMDKVLEAKRRFYKSAVEAGDFSEGVGVIANNLGIYGMPIVIASAIFSTAERNKAASTHTAPDLRQLVTVPAFLYLGTFRASNSNHILVKTLNGNKILDVNMPISSDCSRPNLVSVRLFD